MIQYLRIVLCLHTYYPQNIISFGKHCKTYLSKVHRFPADVCTSVHSIYPSHVFASIQLFPINVTESVIRNNTRDQNSITIRSKIQHNENYTGL